MSALFERVSRLYAQGEAAAPQVLFSDPRIEGIESFIPAAVLVAFVERKDPGMLFLHRPSTMRAHAGQIAFPGGRVDPGEGVVEAALREAWEELGIEPEQVRVIGTGDRYKTGSGYEITPVIGVVPPDISIRPNPAEVAQWFEASAGFVLDRANHQVKTLDWGGKEREYIEVDWRGHRIWGVTGAILHNLAGRLRWHDLEHDEGEDV